MRQLIIVFIIVLAVVFLNYFTGNSLRGLALYFLEKPFLFLTKLFFDIKLFWVSLFNYSGILRENSALYEENSGLISENAGYRLLELQFSQLQKQISSSLPKSYKLEPVKIFLFSYDFKTSSAFIDRGSDLGIVQGQAVIYGGNVLIGRVSEVFKSQSRISLITDLQTQINVRTETNLSALAKGALRKGLTLDFVATEDDIKEGDILFTSGLDGMPENLIVGRVDKIEIASGELFKKVFVKPLFQKNVSIYAFVIMPQ